jgi:hypothetical protein
MQRNRNITPLARVNRPATVRSSSSQSELTALHPSNMPTPPRLSSTPKTVLTATRITTGLDGFIPSG